MVSRFPPVLAVEFGLIEDYGHPRADAAKLVSNKVAHAFLAHFVQPGYADNSDAVETFLERLDEVSTVRSAYARVELCREGMKYHFKLPADRRVTHSDTPPYLTPREALAEVEDSLAESADPGRDRGRLFRLRWQDGSVESSNISLRCGLRPNARRIRPTADWDIPATTCRPAPRSCSRPSRCGRWSGRGWRTRRSRPWGH